MTSNLSPCIMSCRQGIFDSDLIWDVWKPGCDTGVTKRDVCFNCWSCRVSTGLDLLLSGADTVTLVIITLPAALCKHLYYVVSGILRQPYASTLPYFPYLVRAVALLILNSENNGYLTADALTDTRRTNSVAAFCSSTNMCYLRWQIVTTI
jgi:hypothetical protein